MVRCRHLLSINTALCFDEDRVNRFLTDPWSDTDKVRENAVRSHPFSIDFASIIRAILGTTKGPMSTAA